MVACSFDRRGLKLIGVGYPCCMAFAIVVNGNHYILDIAGGAIVVGLAYALVRALPAVKRALLAGTAGTSRRQDSAQSFRSGEPV
jgi:membrane-associated phospholipid phosphatase